MSETSYILVSTDHGIGRITLNRPKALNALDLDMMRVLHDTLTQWRSDPKIRSVLIDHSGGRGFCAGGDIRQIAGRVAQNAPEIDIFPAIEFATNVLIQSYPKPFTSIMDGITMGAGLGISMYGSAFICTDNSLLAMPETAIGLYPDIGACWRLPRLAGTAGRLLCMTGLRIKGRDAAALGLATHYVPPDRLETVASALCMGDQSILDTLAPLSRADLSFADQLDALEACFTHERVEDILHALDQCTAPLAREAAQKLRAAAPCSVKIAAKLTLMAANTPDFAEHMRQEYHLMRRVLRAPDFSEGVRAIIIDKDNAPQWQPARLEDVSDSMVTDMFAPIKDGIELPLATY